MTSHLSPYRAVLARLAACLTVPLAVLATPAIAQSDVTGFPNKTVNLVTPFPPGSGPDAVLRLVGEKLARQWGQAVVVNNRPGGGGFIAIDAARTAAPDGYTLLQLDSEHLAALPLLYKSKNFVTLNVFDPVAPLFRTPFLVTVAADSKWRTMRDLVAAAKAAPGKIGYGSWGIGSPGHLAGEQLELIYDLSMTHVAYREMGQLFTSVGTSDVAWSMGSIPSSQGILKLGKIRYLAVAAPRRIPQMPDVPTVAEAGGPPNFEVNSFVSLVAPKGISPALTAKINADVLKALADPEVTTRFNTFAFEILNWSPAEIRRQADLKFKTYEQLVKRKNISLE